MVMNREVVSSVWKHIYAHNVPLLQTLGDVHVTPEEPGFGLTYSKIRMS